VKHTTWSTGLSVSADGSGVVAHAGSIAVRMLADRTGLTGELSRATARRSFAPVHDRGQVLVDVAVMLADGGEAIGRGRKSEGVHGSAAAQARSGYRFQPDEQDEQDEQDETKP
jgi:hypothetical protein